MLRNLGLDEEQGKETCPNNGKAETAFLKL